MLPQGVSGHTIFRTTNLAKCVMVSAAARNRVTNSAGNRTIGRSHKLATVIYCREQAMNRKRQRDGKRRMASAKTMAAIRARTKTTTAQ